MIGRPLGPLLVGLALLAAGCGGPNAPLEAGVKEYPTDILLGAMDTPAPAVRPVEATVPILIRPRALPERTPSPTLPPLPDPCPEADPLAPVKREAPNRTAGAPVEATHPFRNEGTYEVTGPEAAKGVFPDSERKIEVPSEANSEYVYEVEDSLGITTRYRVVHGEPLASTEPALGPGVYIEAVVSETESGIEVFQPVTPLRLVAFPIVVGNELEAAGASPSGDTVMRFHTTVGKTVPDPEAEEEGATKTEPKARLDACGTKIEGWWVEITDGQIVGPGKDLSFEAWLAIGTQYGAIPLLEEWNITGSLGDGEVDSHRLSTISVEPKVPEE